MLGVAVAGPVRVRDWVKVRVRVRIRVDTILNSRNCCCWVRQERSLDKQNACGAPKRMRHNLVPYSHNSIGSYPVLNPNLDPNPILLRLNSPGFLY